MQDYENKTLVLIKNISRMGLENGQLTVLIIYMLLWMVWIQLPRGCWIFVNINVTGILRIFIFASFFGII